MSKKQSAPHQMPPHPAVNNPKNHPAHNVPPAANDFDGDEMSPAMAPPPGAMGPGY